MFSPLNGLRWPVSPFLAALYNAQPDQGILCPHSARFLLRSCTPALLLQLFCSNHGVFVRDACVCATLTSSILLLHEVICSPTDTRVCRTPICRSVLVCMHKLKVAGSPGHTRLPSRSCMLIYAASCRRYSRGFQQWTFKAARTIAQDKARHVGISNHGNLRPIGDFSSQSGSSPRK
jgi:hypothetical protein